MTPRKEDADISRVVNIDYDKSYHFGKGVGGWERMGSITASVNFSLSPILSLTQSLPFTLDPGKAISFDVKGTIHRSEYSPFAWWSMALAAAIVDNDGNPVSIIGATAPGASGRKAAYKQRNDIKTWLMPFIGTNWIPWEGGVTDTHFAFTDPMGSSPISIQVRAYGHLDRSANWNWSAW